MLRLSRLLQSAAFLAVVAAPIAAWATPITYTDSGIASGTIGKQSFTNSLVVFTFVGDTSNITNDGFLFLNNLGLSTVQIDGVGIASFTSSTFGVADQPSFPGAAFYDAATSFAFGTGSAVFSTYGLDTALGPITGSFITNGASIGEATNFGSLFITSAGNTTFQAITSPIPEPSTLALLGTGVLGVLGAVRRRLC